MAQLANPFNYANPVPPEELIDRGPEAAKLLELALGGHNTRLSAPRRYGKTSLVRKVLADAANEGHPTVYVNFYGVLNATDAVVRLERGYRALKGPLAAWIEGAIRTLRPQIDIPGLPLTIEPQIDAETSARLLSLLDLPRRAAERAGTRVVVAYDEFQAVLQTSPPLDGVMRSVIEHHAEASSYIFCGSHPGLMRELFGVRQRPFFGQARPIELGPLASEDLGAYIDAKFRASRREVGPALGPLLGLVRGHPQRAMMVAHYLWEATGEGATADELTLTHALEAVEAELEEPFAALWQELADSERRVLVALATDPERVMHKQVLDPLGLKRQTARDALGRLRDAGHVDKRDDRFEIVDPLLARWLASGRLSVTNDDSAGGSIG